MTTIRKIVTSKIDGDNANSTDIGEIRPFGEVAVYLDTSIYPNKPTLMMFDGGRTHLKSKVLAQGILYGSNADSGDSNGYDTIKLIPDATLHNNGSDQYLVVDPTTGSPGHIHLRAGGTQDASTADLYLGAEQTFVRVSDTSGNAVIRTSTLGEEVTPHTWTFDNSGVLTFPNATTQTTAFIQGEQIFTLDTGNIDYAPTAVDFNLLFVTPAVGYSSADPTSVTLPNGVPGQRLVIFNGSSLATLTVNPGFLGRDISGGVVAEFIYTSTEGWMPLYGTNSPT
jgi:hypothetical protein